MFFIVVKSVHSIKPGLARPGDLVSRTDIFIRLSEPKCRMLFVYAYARRTTVKQFKEHKVGNKRFVKTIIYNNEEILVFIN